MILPVFDQTYRPLLRPVEGAFRIPIPAEPDIGDIQPLELVLLVWRSGQVTKRRQEVQAGENAGVIDRIDRDLARPTDDERDADSAFVHLVLPATKPFGPSHHVRAGRVTGLVGFQCIECVSGGSLIAGKDHRDDAAKNAGRPEDPADRQVQAPDVGEVVLHACTDTPFPFIPTDIELVGLHIGTEERFIDPQTTELLGEHRIRWDSEMGDVGPHVDIKRSVLVAFDEVHGSLKGVVVAPFGAILQRLEDFDLINAIV